MLLIPVRLIIWIAAFREAKDNKPTWKLPEPKRLRLRRWQIWA
jgi:hypothetical protein